MKFFVFLMLGLIAEPVLAYRVKHTTDASINSGFYLGEKIDGCPTLGFVSAGAVRYEFDEERAQALREMLDEYLRCRRKRI